MKKIILLIFSFVTSVLFSSPMEHGWIIPDEDLVADNGVALYQGKPFTGRSLERESGTSMVYPRGRGSIITWKDGIKNGLTTSFYDDERMQLLAEGELVNGLNHGRLTMWHRNGKFSNISYYRYGLKDGPSTSYYDNGIKAFEGAYVDDERQGDAKLWDRNGKLVYHLVYDRGKTIHTIKEIDPRFNEETGLIEEPKTIDATEGPLK